jgi:ribosomal protein S18 acetylase RimI-like enzyme
MRIRECVHADLPALVELTVETFRPLFEDQVRPAYGDELFDLHHGRWQQDYRDEIPTLHDPVAGRWIAVAEVDRAPVGLVAWSVDAARPDHGRIQLLAVSPPYRREEIGRRLCRHAIDALKAAGVEVVELGTGGEDAFHAPARALYESIGFLKVPIAGYIKKI